MGRGRGGGGFDDGGGWVRGLDEEGGEGEEGGVGFGFGGAPVGEAVSLSVWCEL